MGRAIKRVFRFMFVHFGLREARVTSSSLARRPIVRRVGKIRKLCEWSDGSAVTEMTRGGGPMAPTHKWVVGTQSKHVRQRVGNISSNPASNSEGGMSLGEGTATRRFKVRSPSKFPPTVAHPRSKTTLYIQILFLSICHAELFLLRSDNC